MVSIGRRKRSAPRRSSLETTDRYSCWSWAETPRFCSKSRRPKALLRKTWQNAISRVLIMLYMLPRFSRLVISLAAGSKLKPFGSIEMSNPLTTAPNMATTDESSMTEMVGFFPCRPNKDDQIRMGISGMGTFQVKARESVLFISATLSKPLQPARRGWWSTIGDSCT